MILENLCQIRDTVSHLSANSKERLARDGYEISHARGDESFSNRSKKNLERMQNRTRRSIRRTNYRKITRQSILSSAATMPARTKKAERGTRRKFTSKDLVGHPLFPLPLGAVAGPLLRMAWHSKSGAPPKLFRTIIITCRARRNLLLNIVSGMRRLQRARDGRSLWKKRREIGRVKLSSPSEKHGSLKTSTNILYHSQDGTNQYNKAIQPTNRS